MGSIGKKEEPLQLCLKVYNETFKGGWNFAWKFAIKLSTLLESFTESFNQTFNPQNDPILLLNRCDLVAWKFHCKLSRWYESLIESLQWNFQGALKLCQKLCNQPFNGFWKMWHFVMKCSNGNKCALQTEIKNHCFGWMCFQIGGHVF